MVNCPACGAEVPSGAAQCPDCHLSTGLFPAVREAAGPTPAADPTYLRTIGELLATVDVPPASPAPASRPPQGLLSRPARFPALAMASRPPVPARSDATPITPLKGLPALPATGTIVELNRRVEEYFQLGRRLGLDFTDFERRAGPASLTHDLPSLEGLAREMFVHVAGAVAEELESALARRNELAQLVPTPSADVELNAVRNAIDLGDLNGAQRRLVHVRDELSRLEEEWEVGRILVTECELLAATIRDLGGDPTPALGPLEEGRRAFARGRRTEAERLLSRAAVALWTTLEPRFFEDLHRLRDRLVELRAEGADVSPAVVELRDIATELRQRNFVGTVTAYRRLKGFLDRTSAPGVAAPVEVAAAARSLPSA